MLQVLSNASFQAGRNPTDHNCTAPRPDSYFCWSPAEPAGRTSLCLCDLPATRATREHWSCSSDPAQHRVSSRHCSLPATSPLPLHFPSFCTGKDTDSCRSKSLHELTPVKKMKSLCAAGSEICHMLINFEPPAGIAVQRPTQQKVTAVNSVLRYQHCHDYPHGTGKNNNLLLLITTPFTSQKKETILC